MRIWVTDPETHVRVETKINGYVDDGQLFDTSEESITECFKTLDMFENASGARVNKNKTFGLILVRGGIKLPIIRILNGQTLM